MTGGCAVFCCPCVDVLLLVDASVEVLGPVQDVEVGSRLVGYAPASCLVP